MRREERSTQGPYCHSERSEESKEAGTGMLRHHSQCCRHSTYRQEQHPGFFTAFRMTGRGFGCLSSALPHFECLLLARLGLLVGRKLYPFVSLFVHLLYDPQVHVLWFTKVSAKAKQSHKSNSNKNTSASDHKGGSRLCSGPTRETRVKFRRSAPETGIQDALSKTDIQRK